MKVSRIIRWVLALGSLVFCISQAAAALKTPGLGAAGYLIISFASLLTFLILISPETILRGCEVFSRLFTTIVLPDDKERKPPLSYLLARRYRKQLRSDEAAAEYRKIIHYYPNERDAYLELIALALEIGDEKFASKYTRAFETRFKCRIPDRALPEESQLPPPLPKELSQDALP